jgi:hypothetical protein
MFDFKKFRSANNLTQDDAAMCFGVIQTFISQLKRNIRPVPDDFMSKIKVDSKFMIQERRETVSLTKMPTYSSCSLLLVHKVEGWAEYFRYGFCYVVFSKDGSRILKEVQKSETDSQKYVSCVSYNPKNSLEELPCDFIISVYGCYGIYY